MKKTPPQRERAANPQIATLFNLIDTSTTRARCQSAHTPAFSRLVRRVVHQGGPARACPPPAQSKPKPRRQTRSASKSPWRRWSASTHSLLPGPPRSWNSPCALRISPLPCTLSLSFPAGQQRVMEAAVEEHVGLAALFEQPPPLTTRLHARCCSSRSCTALAATPYIYAYGW
jgi:hypothetical protein